MKESTIISTSIKFDEENGCMIENHDDEDQVKLTKSTRRTYHRRKSSDTILLQETQPLLSSENLNVSGLFIDDENNNIEHEKKSNKVDGNKYNYQDENALDSLYSGIKNHSKIEIPPNCLVPIKDEKNKKEDKQMKQINQQKEERKAIKIAAAFLHDYEQAQKITLQPNTECISNLQLKIFIFRESTFWQYVIFGTTLCFFLASTFEGNEQDPIHTRNSFVLLILSLWSVFIFCIDLILTYAYSGRRSILNVTSNATTEKIVNGSTPKPANIASTENKDQPKDHNNLINTEHTTSILLTIFLFVYSIELWIFTRNNDENSIHRSMWSGAFKPILFFHFSSRARDAFHALKAVLPMVLQVIVLELFLIFMFAVMACELFSDNTSTNENENYHFYFQDKQTAFLSMFELSTTVVNPSIWMQLYAERPYSAFFFVTFVILNVFYMHSLVLSVVFQSYVQKIRDIRMTKKIYREEALKISFKTLYKLDHESLPPHTISTRTFEKTLSHIRHHYGIKKIKALVELVDTQKKGYIDYHTFRTNLPRALNTSLKLQRIPTRFSVAVDVLALFVALINLIYVLSFSGSNNLSPSMQAFAIMLGAIITIFGMIDLIIRINPFRILNNSSSVKIDNTFDALALASATISLFGMLQSKKKLTLIMVGRSLDLFRCTRFVSFFRNIIYRSGKVLPVFVGPLILVASAVHIFCYIGMGLWGGMVKVGTIQNISPYYDYNNFNTYHGGLLTMFQVLVINDWNQVAKVFLSINNGRLVFPFFICANIISVSILLNIFITFFIGAFLTEMPKHDKRNDPFYSIGEMTTGMSKDLSSPSLRSIPLNKSQEIFNINESTVEESGSYGSLRVSERQGFDNVMQSVLGGTIDEDKTPKIFSRFLELFEVLTPDNEKVGYLVCNQKSMDRYGNRRFQSMMNEFMNDEMMHNVLGDISDEIVAMSHEEMKKEDYIQRTFEHASGKILEVKASILNDDVSIVIFVAQIKYFETMCIKNRNMNH